MDECQNWGEASLHWKRFFFLLYFMVFPSSLSKSLSLDILFWSNKIRINFISGRMKRMQVILMYMGWKRSVTSWGFVRN